MWLRRRIGELPDVADPDALRDAGYEAGAIVEVPNLVVMDQRGRDHRVPTPHGAVVVSQTCDVVLEGRQMVQLAKLVQLSGELAEQATDRRRPRYVAVPAAGEGFFADLDFVTSVHKDHLATLETPRRGLTTDDHVREYGRDVGRRYSRFPFPDEVVPWLQPLEDLVREKYAKPQSPLGRVLHEIIELRVEAENGWSNGAPYDLTLVMIVEKGVLPAFDGPPEPPRDQQSWWNQHPRTAADVATRLQSAGTPEARSFLWNCLGEAMVAKCTPGTREPDDVQFAVAGGAFVPEVVSEDEYTLDRVRRSEILDLDHLSTPRPH